MTLITRTFHPVLTSPGASGGMIAFAFATVEEHVSLTHSASNAEVLHVGQLAVNQVLEDQGVKDSLTVETTLSPEQLDSPVWRISLAVNSLIALRDALPGLSEVLYPENILAVLDRLKIARKMRDGHIVRAAIGGGIHARVDLDGGAVDFDLPDAAMIWLEVPYAASSSAWTQAQSSKVSSKRASASAERFAASILRAACNDGIAIFEAWESVDLPETILASYPGWIPAQNAARHAAAHARVSLIGAGPDMLIVAADEAIASAAAHAAIQTFEAHALECAVNAWSSITEPEDLLQ